LRNIIIILLIGFCVASCKDKNALPAGILSKEKMQAVLWDVINAEAFTNSYIKRDTTKNKNLVLEDAKLQHQVFAINNVTKDEFYTSYDYYRMHPDLLLAVLDSIDAISGRENNLLHGKNSPYPNPRDRFSNRHFPGMPFLKDSLHGPGFNHMSYIRDSLAEARSNHNPFLQKK
jgi:hypothetical protein